MGTTKELVKDPDQTGDNLPLIKDLPDLRLPRVFQAWADFKANHSEQIATIGDLHPKQVTHLAQDLSRRVSQSVYTGADSGVSIDPERLTRLTSAVSGESNGVIFMRHGEQSPPQWVYSIQDSGLRKIMMMQDPVNNQDLLTNQGLVDVFVTGLGLLHVTQAAKKDMHVISSENMRAKEAAVIIAEIVPSVSSSIHEGLSSISYRDERDKPPATLEELLQELPTGCMPWTPKLVDKWCKAAKSGILQSRLITETIGNLVQKGKGEGRDLYLVLTHSQQLAEVLRLAGKLEDPAIRFPELTMIIQKEAAVQIMSRGFLVDIPKLSQEGKN